MKDNYETPELEIIVLEPSRDVLLTSPGNCGLVNGVWQEEII